MPNAFSPNGDGTNDGFTAVGTGIGEYEMLIFDRWGNLIYKTNDINKPWDGRVKQKGEEVQEDVYVYKIRVTEFDSKKEHLFEGLVSVVKSQAGKARAKKRG